TDLAGNRVPGVAPHRLEGSLLATSGAWFGGVDARRVSAVPVSDRDAAGVLASPAYTLVDVRTGWEGVRFGRAAWTPFIGATNLFGATYNATVAVNAFGSRFYEPGPGRALYAGVTLNTGGG
ncbi:MAG: TonB-dependent receptor, partial [Gemmatimonadota bacterium]|nr:TonB-dependent receptor [Gemmatimonadota bacterium]